MRPINSAHSTFALDLLLVANDACTGPGRKAAIPAQSAILIACNPAVIKPRHGTFAVNDRQARADHSSLSLFQAAPSAFTIAKNSWRLIGSFRKQPSIRLVVKSTPCIFTPRLEMQ